MGLKLTTLKSGPLLRSTVGFLTTWATQVSPQSFFKWERVEKASRGRPSGAPWGLGWGGSGWGQGSLASTPEAAVCSVSFPSLGMPNTSTPALPVGEMLGLFRMPRSAGFYCQFTEPLVLSQLRKYSFNSRCHFDETISFLSFPSLLPSLFLPPFLWCCWVCTIAGGTMEGAMGAW